MAFDLKKLLTGENPFQPSKPVPVATIPASTARPQQNPIQSYVNQAQGIAKGAGGVVGNIAKGIAQPYNYLSTGIAEVANDLSGNADRQAQAQLAQQQNDVATIKKLGVQLKASTDPTQQARIRSGINKVSGIDQNTDALNIARQSEIQQRTDPTKGVASVGSIGLDALTAGFGTAGVQGAKTALTQGGKIGLAKELANQSLKTAAIGAPSGAISPFLDKGSDTSFGDVLKGAGTGALVGGLIPGASYGASKIAPVIARGAQEGARGTTQLVQKANQAVEQVNPAVKELDNTLGNYQRAFDVETDPTRRAQINQGIADLNAQRRQVTQGGYVKNPGFSESDDLASSGRIQPEQLPGQDISQQPETLQPQYQNSIDNLKIDSYAKPSTSDKINQGTSRFSSVTAPASRNVSDELSARIKQSAPTYNVATNESASNTSIARLNNQGNDAVYNDVLNTLGKNNTDKQVVSDALETASRLDAKGDETSLRQATDIYDKLAEQLTKAGQTVQAANLVNRRTPQGLLFDAQRQLNNAKIPLTPELRQTLLDKANQLTQLPIGSAERQAATAEFQQLVNRNIPTDLTDKIVGTWKAGLLTGVRTQTGNILSNSTFRGLREVSRPGAVLADMVASIFTGKRSVALTGRGALSGAGEGVRKGIKSIKTGVDERSFSADGKYLDREINFKNKALGTYVNGVFRLMGAADRPFYYSQFRNSLAEAATVEAKNQKLTGRAYKDYINKAIENPTDEAAQYATNVAEQAVLANDTFLSDVANKLRSAAEKQTNPAARAVTKATIGVLAPFTKVPSAFLSRVIDFTPGGAVKEVVSQLASKKLDQAKLVQAISEAGTGTGLIYLGAELANNDMLSGNYPNDPKEQARWKAEGITPNSIKVGNTWYSLNYAGPVGALFGIGKSVTDAAKEGADVTGALSAGAGQLATGTLEQSFLSGISGALDAVQDPKRYAQNFVKSQAGSVVPTLVNDIGNATDKMQRQANSVGDAVKARIPGLRQTLNAKSDAFGNQLDQPEANPINQLTNPLRPSKSRSTDLTNELDRLKSTSDDNFVFPTTDKTIKVSGQTVKLTPNQQKEYNDSVGQETQLIWGNIINSPEYLALDDASKADALRRASTDINAVSKKQYLESIGQNNIADAIKLTKRQETYAQGDVTGQLSVANKQTNAPAKTKATKSTTSKAKSTKVSKAKSSSKASKKDYASRFAVINNLGTANQKALRNLVKGRKITRKKVKA